MAVMRKVDLRPMELRRTSLVVAAATMTLSGFLLFQVQPMMARYILPWFGGSATTWTVCLLFFQVGLLFGYAYAFQFTTRYGLVTQVAIHVSLLLASLISLPITPSHAFKPQDADDPTLRIIVLLLYCVGLPYLLLSTTTPLVQRWLSNLGAVNPSRLFALSNLGSFLGLVSYPILDLYFPTNSQTFAWSAAYAVYALLLTSFVALILARRHLISHSRPTTVGSVSELDAGQILVWFLLSMLGSISLLAVTNYITSYVSVNPFLWILPLGIYLLSFTLTFGNTRFYRPSIAGVLYAVSLILNFFTATDYGIDDAFGVIAINLICFGFCCLICQGELARRQPEPGKLTLFYLTIAAGGAIGACFVSLLAPVAFPDYWELPIGLIGVGTLYIVLHLSPSWGRPIHRAVTLFVTSGVVVAFLLVVYSELFEGGEVIDQRRNFYGVIQVEEVDAEKPDSYRYVMKQAGERQGEQFQSPQLRRTAPCDFDRNSGIGRVLDYLQQRGADGVKIGVVGLGAGMLTTQGRPQDSFRYYELNPYVADLAREDFTFLKDAKSAITVVLGDGRLSLERELAAAGPQNYDLIHVDAFRGNAPPAHLMTAQAFEVYFKHLKPGGALAVTSHRDYYDASSLFRGMADLLGVEVRWFPAAKGCATGVGFAIFSRDPALFADPRIGSRGGAWDDHENSKIVWTDQSSSLMSLLIWSR